MPKMNKEKLDDYLANIDNFYNYLKEQDRTKIQGQGYKKLHFSLDRCFKNFTKTLSRVHNRLAGDKRDYSEKMASRVIQQFIQEEDLHTPETVGKVKTLYRYLKGISNGNGSYADGLSFYEVGIKDREQKKRFEPIIGMKRPSTRLLFHGLADEFGKSSNLEGGKSSSTLQYLAEFLSRKNSYQLKEGALQEIKACSQLQQQFSPEKKAKEMKKQIEKGLREVKPILVSGTFKAAEGGHEICFEIIPQADGTANFRIHNTGLGIEAYHPKAQIGNKEKLIYVEWTGIPIENLKNPSLTSLIVQLANPKDDFKIQTKHIYEGLRNVLRPTGETHFEDSEVHPNSDFMTPQRAGVCSWKAYMSFMRTKMELEDYKRFKMDLKLQMTLDYVDAMGKEVLSPEKRNLVQRGYEKLNRNLVHLHAQGMIDDLYLTSAKKALKKVDHFLAMHPKTINKREPLTAEQFVYQANKESLSFPIPKQQTILAEGKSSLPPAAILAQEARHPPVEEIYQFSFPQPFDLNLVSAHLKKIQEVGEKAWNEGIDELAFQRAAIHYIKQIPLAIDSWGVDKEQAQQLMIQLGSLSSLLFKTSFTVPNPEQIPVERTYVLKKLFYLQNQLMVKAIGKDEGMLAFAKIRFFWPNFSERLPLTGTVTDSHVQKELEKINTFTALSEGRVYRSYVDDEKASISLTYYQEYVKRANELNLDYYPFAKMIHDLLMAEDPSGRKLEQALDLSLREKILVAKQGRIDYVQMACKLENSRYLPDWIKAVRETHLQMKWLSKGYVDSLAHLNRKKDLRFDFTYDLGSFNRYYKNEVHAEARLKGVPKRKLGKKDKLTPITDTLESLHILTHRPFKDPKLETLLRSILRWTGERHEQKMEKGILSELKFDEELRSLHSIAHYQNLQIHELLAHFQKYQARLNDPDYQTFFFLFLFRPHVMKDMEPIISSIHAWTVHAEEEGNYQTVIFLRGILRRLAAFDQDSHPLIVNHTTSLRAMLDDARFSPSHKSLVYAELMSCFASKQSLNDEEMELFLKGKAFLAKYPVPSDWSIPQMMAEVEEATIKHSAAVLDFLSKAPEKVEEVYKTVHGQSSGSSWNQREGGYFENDDTTLSYVPLTGQFLGKDQSKTTRLPAFILEHPDFKALFPKLINVEIENQGCYSFTQGEGANKRKFLVKFDFATRTLILEQEENGEILRLVPSRHFIHKKTLEKKEPKESFSLLTILGAILRKIIYRDPAKFFEAQQRHDKEEFEKKRKSESFIHTDPLISRYLAEKYSVWQSVDQPNRLYLQNTSGKREYEVILSGNKVTKIIRIEDRVLLGKTDSTFSHFEHPIYTHQWYRKKEIEEVEFPRFGLSFKRNPHSKLESREFKGFFLSPNQQIPALGAYRQYLVLENDRGEKKILLPHQSFEMDEAHGEYNPVDVLHPQFRLDQNAELGVSLKENYFSYDLKKDGSLKGFTALADAHLSGVLIAFKEYKAAERLLKPLEERLTPLSQEEKSALMGISTIAEVTNDESANGSAAALFAEMLLAKDQQQFSQMEYDSKSLQQLYDRYLKLYNQVTTFKLSKEQELFIIKMIGINKLSPAGLMRLREIEPSLYIAQPMENAPVQEPLHPFKKPYRASTPSLNESNLSELSVENCEKYIVDQFFQLYDMARKGSEKEKEMLRTGLAFAGPVLPETKRVYAAILQTVLDQPEKYQSNDYPRSASLAIINNPMVKLMGKVYMTPDLGSRLAPNAEKDQKEALEKWFQDLFEKMELSPTAKTLFYSDAVPPTTYMRTPEDFALDRKGPLINPVYNIQQVRKVASLSYKIAIRLHENVSPMPANTLNTMSNWVGDQKGNYQDDVLVQAQLDNLSQDIESRKHDAISTFNISDENLPKIEKRNGELADKEAKELKELEDQILLLANRSDASLESHLEKLKIRGGVKDSVAFNQILVSFGRKDPKMLLALNPLLKQEDLDRLYSLVGNYLQRSVRLNQMNRVLETAEKLKTAPPESQEELKAQLASDLMISSYYDLHEHPEYLVFEHFAGITMRKAQVEKLELFFQEGDIGMVSEMIMGSGKSKVLLPLLGLLRADGENISLLVVSEPLFASVASDTQKVLSGAFGQPLRTLYFDRNSQFTATSLQILYDNLMRCKDKKECLIMTSKSILCLVLKCIEAHYKYYHEGHSADEPLPVELDLMRKIMDLVGTQAIPAFDEADTLFNAMQEVNFSLGKEIHPPFYETDVIGEMYKLLYTHPEVRSLGALESDCRPEKGLPRITEDDYKKKIQPKLASLFLNRLKEMTFKEPSQTEKIRRVLNGLTTEQNALIEAFLVRDEKRFETAEKFVKTLDPEAQNILALASGDIGCLISHCLTRNCDEDYGSDPLGGLLAIPYSRARAPNIGSEFSIRHVTINYTYQYYVKHGLSVSVMDDQLKRLASQIRREQRLNPHKPKEEIEAWKKLDKILGNFPLNPLNYTENELQQFVNHINSGPERVIDLVSTLFIPTIKQYDKKITCNPINLASIFLRKRGDKRAVAFTGTLWNALSMHRMMEAFAEIGTSAKTLEILWKNSAQAVHVIQENSQEQMLDQLEKKGIHFDLISDAGGYFKSGTNLEMARLSAIKYGKPCVFYDSENRQMITNGQQEELLADSPFKEDERITFLDQSHTTGADVKQKRDAVGIVTIGSNMLLRDLAQSVWRLRGLDKSQKVVFVLTDDVKNLIKHKLQLQDDQLIEFKEILLFTLLNQSHELGEHILLSFRQQLEDVLQSLLLDVLLGEYTEEQKQQAFLAMEQLWIKPAEISPMDLFGQSKAEVEKEILVKFEVKEAKAKLEQLYHDLPFLDSSNKNDYLDAMDQIGAHVLPHLPAFIPMPSQNLGQTTEVQTQTEVKSEVRSEVKQEQLNQKDTPKLGALDNHTLRLIPFSSLMEMLSSGKEIIAKFLPVFPFSEYFRKKELYQKWAVLFDDVHLTFNVLQWEFKKNMGRGLGWNLDEVDPNSSFEFFGAKRTPIVHLYYEVIDDTSFRNSKRCLIALSQEEAAKYESEPGYRNLELYKPTDAEIPQIAKLKFLNGESTFSQKELEALGKICQDHRMSKKELQEFYLTHVLSGHPLQLEAYEQSNLKQFFES